MKASIARTLLLVLLSLGVTSAAAKADGIVLERVGPGSALEKAGLRAGDVALSWERDGERGEIRTPFDWMRVTREQAPRGTVRILGERQAFEVRPGVWEGHARPHMAAEALAAYEEGRRKIDAGDLDGGIALWDELGRKAPDLAAWLLYETGDVLSENGRIPRAQKALQAALAAAPDPQTRVPVLEMLSRSQELGTAMDLAEASLRSALETGEQAWGEGLQVAHSLTRLANLLRLRNRLDESEQVQTRALRIQERLAPDSLELGDSLAQLAGVAWARGELDAMDAVVRRGLAIQERLAPDSLMMARSLVSLGLLETDRGRLEEAAAALQRALAIQERRSPGSRPVAMTLNNLGLVARIRGDAETAEETFHRALAIWEKLAPEGFGIAPVLNNLAALARERGDLDEAEALFQRALTIWGKTAPEGIGVAGGYDSLGMLEQERGNLDKAWSYHSRAFAIVEKLAPGSTEAANMLQNLGLVAEARGDLATALGHYQRAVSLLERLSPGSIGEALALKRLGHLYRRQGNLGESARLLDRAVDALESQVGTLGGSHELRAEYRARHEEIYREAIEVEVEQGHETEAFHLAERSRARSFLALLAERDLGFAGDLPEALAHARRDNAARYDRALRALAAWTEKDGEPAREALQRELTALRRERDTIAADVRKASPRLAALAEPRPLDLAAARQVLDPGTLAISYSVGREKTVLFALTRDGGLRVATLPVGEDRLRRETGSFLERVRAQEKPATDLYRELIAPVADLVERSERLLILPDGPLHRLPFGALVRDDGRYLIEGRPVHTALSLTVYGTLRASEAAPPGPVQLVAFADPRFPPAMAAKKMDLAPGLRRFDWSSLPWSRREAERLAAIYPGARLYLGEEATEERAKSVRGARILHFATHGYMDDRTPLDSALVLTIPENLAPGQDNGLLQVWEIFEGVRLDADLVVLSACESALGREQSGEGLIGLTRAFQYAGARSVVASLWSVADQVTAELMERFHRHLAAGLPKDEALRAAQLELIRGPVEITAAQGQAIEMDASAPFFWAAFQLFGDRR